jgi:hypothetical protein
MNPIAIAIRGYAIPFKDHDDPDVTISKPRKRKGLRKPSRETLIFDCETTTDHAQNLRFGTYQCRREGKLVEQGIFYEPDNPRALSAKDIAVIHNYAAKCGLKCRTRDEFIQDIFYRYAYAYGAAVVGFNLPFDISRLAIKFGTAHARDMRGGFTFKLSNTPHHPNVVIKHLNSRASFIRFAASGQWDSRSERKKGIRKEHRTGYFQDVKTLAAALLGKGHSLKSLADTLETEHRKLDAGGHNRAVTTRYLDYAMADTQVTWECYEKLLTMYETHGLTDMPAHRIYSEASLGKAYLSHMGIQPLRKVQTGIPPELIGQIMGAYYGGRAEVRIRRQITRVLYCDFRSMYPTVCTLMGLWRFVIAKGFDWADWTAEARSLLERAELGDLQNPAFWKALTVLVQIEPNDDIPPVRAAYDGRSRTIGLNYLTAKFPLWFTLADCIASKLLTGRAPKMVRATRFSPKGVQSGLKPIRIAGDEGQSIDPAGEDFFRDLIIQRGKVQSTLKCESDPHKRDLLDAQQMMLKLLANSTSYGIYAEQNVQSHDRPSQVTLYGQEDSFRTGSKSIEEPGTHFYPLIATLITGAARLMLACAECVADTNGLGWVFCDTDSLALARPEGMDDKAFLQRCARVTGWFDRLDPYGDGKPLFKVEDQNFRLEDSKPTQEHEPLYALAVSAKRYVLFNRDADGRPVIRKALAHGLGHLMEPYGEKDAPKSIPLPPQGLAGLEVKRWQHDLWYQIVLAFLEGHPDRIVFPKTPKLDQPARSRYGATTPSLLNWFCHFNEGKPLSEQVKPFNFMLAYSTSKIRFAKAIANGDLDDEFIGNGLPAAAAPYHDNTENAVVGAFDRRTGNPVPSSIFKTYREAISEYAWHSESKFGNGDTHDTGITRRRHIEAIAVEYIGKESNRWEEQFFLGETTEALIEYGLHPDGHQRLIGMLTEAAGAYGMEKLASAADLSRQQLHAIIKCKARSKRSTIIRLCWAIRLLARPDRPS